MEWCTVRAPVFGRHQFFGTSEHYGGGGGEAHGTLSSGWMNYNYTACCWFPTSNNILILPSQFWQIRFESCWLHCSKCRILVLLRYMIYIFLPSILGSAFSSGGCIVFWKTLFFFYQKPFPIHDQTKINLTSKLQVNQLYLATEFNVT